MADNDTTTLLSAWRATVAAAPEALALIDTDDRRWTRAELDARASAFRATLPPEAARRRVAFSLPNGPAWLAAFLGLLAAEATPVPLDGSEPPDAQHALARAAGCAFIRVGDTLSPVVSDAPLPRPVARGRSPALVKLTSGSTGRPQALAFSHAQMFADGRQVCAGMGIGPDDINLAVIPFGHSYGLGNLVMPLLIQGTASVCTGIPLPHALAADIARARPTVFPAVPALLRALADSDLPADALAPIRTVISAGAPLSADIAQAFHRRFGLAPHGFYGSTETGGISYDRDGAATLAGRGVGTALPGVTLTPRRDGRMRVTSPAVFRAAGHAPADRVRITPEGELVLLGRAGRMVKIGGRRLDLAALENELRALPGVSDAFVAPHPDSPEQLAAVLATALPAAELRALLRARLAVWKIPRRLVPLATFPLTARGKTDTAALRARLASA